MFRFFVYLSFLLVLIISCGTTAQQRYVNHAVQKGETVGSIASDYKISKRTLYNLNPEVKDGLKPNSILILPAKEVIGPSASGYREHKVKKKETLYGVARQYDVSEESIKKLNRELYARGPKIGEVLRIPASAETIPVKEKETADKNSYTVQPKDTKYGIARTFGITVAELEKLNPEMGDTLQVGSVLKVPEKTIPDKESLDEENFQYYEVAPKEGFYRLSVKFGLSEEEIIALNPHAKEGLKEGMILKLPRSDDDDDDSEASVVNLEDRIKNPEMKQLALMLPFRLDQVEKDSLQNRELLLKSTPALRIALDFYSGALMAAEFAKDRGISVTLKVFDTDQNLNSIVKNPGFKNTDAVIGPLLKNQVEEVAALLERDEIPVFSPLSNSVVPIRKNLFQALPTTEVLQKSMVDYLKNHAPGKNTIIITDSRNQRQRNLLSQNLPAARVLVKNQEHLQSKDITEAASRGMDNWVILASDDPILVSSTVNVLSAMPKDYNFRLFTLNKSEVYDWEEVSNSRLARLNFTFPSVRQYYFSEEEASFITKYKKKYGVIPNRYAIRGFDLTFDVLLRLASGDDILQTAGTLETNYIENKFRYEKSDQKGFANQAVYILKYNENLKFDVVE